MFTLCISVIALLQVAEGFSYNGEPSYLIEIPKENRNDSMCRNETDEEATRDVKNADATYCPGLLEFLDLMMDPTGEDAINTFIRTVNNSVYGSVIENFTIMRGFSDKERLLRNIWFRGNDSLFKRVFVENNYGNVSRISSFGSYLYESTTQRTSSYHHSKGHQNCTNETEVSIAACYFHYEPKSIVYIHEVNPLFDFTVFSLAAMMGKLIENKTTKRNLTFVVQHPDDRDCLVPLTVIYRSFNNTPPIYLTYHKIKLIYYDYNGEHGKTNFDVCDFVQPKDTNKDEDYDDEVNYDEDNYDDEYNDRTKNQTDSTVYDKPKKNKDKPPTKAPKQNKTKNKKGVKTNNF